MTRRRYVSLAFALACIVGSTPAGAQGTTYATEQPAQVSDAELAQQRGGFVWHGLDIQFGVELTSYIGDKLVLRTDAGLQDALRDSVLLANNGQTRFIQRTDGTIQNIIVNTASGVALRQQIDARLDIAGFAPFRAAALASRIGAALTGVQMPVR